MEKTVCVTVNKEIVKYCKKDTQSLLRSKGQGKNDLKSFSFANLEKELEATTPLFWQIVQAATFNESHERNKKKTKDSIIPATLTAAAKLISIHTEDMNVFKQVHSIILKKAGLKKMGFTRLGKTYDTMSYDFVNGLLDVYADNFEQTINQWKSEIEEPQSVHPSYTLANDNVDWEVGPRQVTGINQKKSVHKVNVVAYKNRVNSVTLPNDGPQADITTVPLQDLLPSADDTAKLTDHLIVLVGNIWANAIGALSWFKEHLPDHIPHDYERQMKQKTQKTQLGLYNYDQKKVDDVQELLTELHSSYVPNHSDTEDTEVPKPKRIILRADYLGFERQKAAQSQVHDARTPSKRLEGFVSALTDFHAQAAWHHVAWSFLYDTLTEREAGTLYHARQVTDSRSVTKDPHDDFYAAEDLLDKFTQAYLIAGALNHFGMESVDDEEPTLNKFDAMQQVPKEYVQNIIKSFVSDHVLNPPPSLPGDDIRKCRYCGKAYKQQKRLDDHEKKHRELLAKEPPKDSLRCDICGKVYTRESALTKHITTHSDEERNVVQPNAEGMADYVYNYTRRVMSVCGLRLNFEDAIKRGDGERVFLCYKFMYLYFKEGNCPKYAYGTLETICQAKYLLSPQQSHDLVWNRFVNNKGEADSNLPVDLDVEHLNKPLKTDLNTYRGEITEKSVQRISRSVEETEKILKNYDKQLGVKKPSGRHKAADFDKDINDLAVLLHEKKVFRQMPGREHMHIRKISADALAPVNMKDINAWMKKSVSKFADKHYYQC